MHRRNMYSLSWVYETKTTQKWCWRTRQRWVLGVWIVRLLPHVVSFPAAWDASWQVYLQLVPRQVLGKVHLPFNGHYLHTHMLLEIRLLQFRRAGLSLGSSRLYNSPKISSTSLGALTQQFICFSWEHAVCPSFVLIPSSCRSCPFF